MPTRLDGEQVAEALRRLTGWTGDTDRISRTVSVAASRTDALLQEVGAAADAMDHHPVVERSEDRVTFAVWTHSAGGVTGLDLELAARIDELVAVAEGG